MLKRNVGKKLLRTLFTVFILVVVFTVGAFAHTIDVDVKSCENSINNNDSSIQLSAKNTTNLKYSGVSLKVNVPEGYSCILNDTNKNEVVLDDLFPYQECTFSSGVINKLLTKDNNSDNGGKTTESVTVTNTGNKTTANKKVNNISKTDTNSINENDNAENIITDAKTDNQVGSVNNDNATNSDSVNETQQKKESNKTVWIILAVVLAVIIVVLTIVIIKKKKAGKVLSICLCLVLALQGIVACAGQVYAAEIATEKYTITKEIKLGGKTQTITIDVVVPQGEDISVPASANVESVNTIAEGAQDCVVNLKSDCDFSSDITTEDIIVSDGFSNTTVTNIELTDDNQLAISLCGTVGEGQGVVSLASNCFAQERTNAIVYVPISPAEIVVNYEDITFADNKLSLPLNICYGEINETLNSSDISIDCDEATINDVQPRTETNGMVLVLNVVATDINEAINKISGSEIRIDASALNCPEIKTELVLPYATTSLWAIYINHNQITAPDTYPCTIEFDAEIMPNVADGAIGNYSADEVLINVVAPDDYGVPTLTEKELAFNDNAPEGINTKVQLVCENSEQYNNVMELVNSDDFSFINFECLFPSGTFENLWGTPVAPTTMYADLSYSNLGGILDDFSIEGLAIKMGKKVLGVAAEKGFNKMLGIPSMSDLGDSIDALSEQSREQYLEIVSSLSELQSDVSYIKEAESMNLVNTTELVADSKTEQYLTVVTQYISTLNQLQRKIKSRIGTDKLNKKLLALEKCKDNPEEYQEEFIDLCSYLDTKLGGVDFVELVFELGALIQGEESLGVNPLSEYYDEYIMANSDKNFDTQLNNEFNAFRCWVSSNYAEFHILAMLILVDEAAQEDETIEENSSYADLVDLAADVNDVLTFKQSNNNITSLVTRKSYSKVLDVSAYTSAVCKDLKAGTNALQPNSIQLTEMINRANKNENHSLLEDMIDAGFILKDGMKPYKKVKLPPSAFEDMIRYYTPKMYIKDYWNSAGLSSVSSISFPLNGTVKVGTVENDWIGTRDSHYPQFSEFVTVGGLNYTNDLLEGDNSNNEIKNDIRIFCYPKTVEVAFYTYCDDILVDSIDTLNSIVPYKTDTESKYREYKSTYNEYQDKLNEYNRKKSNHELDSVSDDYNYRRDNLSKYNDYRMQEISEFITDYEAGVYSDSNLRAKFDANKRYYFMFKQAV